MSAFDNISQTIDPNTGYPVVDPDVNGGLPNRYLPPNPYQAYPLGQAPPGMMPPAYPAPHQIARGGFFQGMTSASFGQQSAQPLYLFGGSLAMTNQFQPAALDWMSNQLLGNSSLSTLPWQGTGSLTTQEFFRGQMNRAEGGMVAEQMLGMNPQTRGMPGFLSKAINSDYMSAGRLMHGVMGPRMRSVGIGMEQRQRTSLHMLQTIHNQGNAEASVSGLPFDRAQFSGLEIDDVAGVAGVMTTAGFGLTTRDFINNSANHVAGGNGSRFVASQLRVGSQAMARTRDVMGMKDASNLEVAQAFSDLTGAGQGRSMTEANADLNKIRQVSEAVGVDAKVLAEYQKMMKQVINNMGVTGPQAFGMATNITARAASLQLDASNRGVNMSHAEAARQASAGIDMVTGSPGAKLVDTRMATMMTMSDAELKNIDIGGQNGAQLKRELMSLTATLKKDPNNVAAGERYSKLLAIMNTGKVGGSGADGFNRNVAYNSNQDQESLNAVMQGAVYDTLELASLGVYSADILSESSAYADTKILNEKLHRKLVRTTSMGAESPEEALRGVKGFLDTEEGRSLMAEHGATDKDAFARQILMDQGKVYSRMGNNTTTGRAATNAALLGNSSSVKVASGLMADAIQNLGPAQGVGEAAKSAIMAGIKGIDDVATLKAAGAEMLTDEEYKATNGDPEAIKQKLMEKARAAGKDPASALAFLDKAMKSTSLGEKFGRSASVEMASRLGYSAQLGMRLENSDRKWVRYKGTDMTYDEMQAMFSGSDDPDAQREMTVAVTESMRREGGAAFGRSAKVVNGVMDSIKGLGLGGVLSQIGKTAIGGAASAADKIKEIDWGGVTGEVQTTLKSMDEKLGLIVENTGGAGDSATSTEAIGGKDVPGTT